MMWTRVRKWLLRKCMSIAQSRKPDFVIGDHYLDRWWVVPRNPFFNVYLHNIRKSDDDRALHDHPWWNLSILLDGSYLEHVPWRRVKLGDGWVRDYSEMDGRRRTVIRRKEGAVIGRLGRSQHRLEIDETGRPVWTLFITGPRFRRWGFACPQGWRHWRLFVGDDKGQVGRGCD